MASLPMSEFRFESYIVNYIRYEKNSDFLQTEVEIDFSIEGEVKIDQAQYRSAVTLVAKAFLDENTPKGKIPFTMEVSITGFFAADREAVPFEQFELMCKHNAPAVLFPFVRGAIADITRIANQSPLVIPLMNLSNFFPIVPNQETTLSESEIGPTEALSVPAASSPAPSPPQLI